MNNIDLVSEKYRKFLCSVKLDSRIHYFVAGCDINNFNDDKLLLDSRGMLILMPASNSIFGIAEMNEALIFDRDNFIEWVEELKPLLTAGNSYTYALYDMDLLYNELLMKSLYNIQTLAPKTIEEFVNFVNLADDFAIQTHNKNLKELIRSESMTLLWESYYDIEIWNKDKDTILNHLILKFNEIDFKISFAKIYSIFISSFHFC